MNCILNNANRQHNFYTENFHGHQRGSQEWGCGYLHTPIHPVNLEAWSEQRGGSVNRPDKSQSLCIICQWLLIAFLISGLKGLKVDLNTQENFLFLGVKPVSSGKDLILSKAVSSHLIGYPRDLKSLYKFWALASKSFLLEQMWKSLINWLYGRPRFKDMGWALFACKRLFFCSFLSI